MEHILNAAEAKEIDRYTMEEIGIPGIVLMERAALAAANEAMNYSKPGDAVLALCGVGNNGADGLAVSRILFQNGRKVKVFLLGNPEKATEDNLLQQKILKNLGIGIITCKMKDAETPVLSGEAPVLVIDAMFGVGLKRELRAEYAYVCGAVCSLREQGAAVLAVDIPSGISADSGKVFGSAVKADVTVTFGYRKLGHVLYPGALYAGEVKTVPIGFEMPEIMKNETVKVIRDKNDLHLPGRRPDGNKGTFGKVLIAAGSVGMCGAAYLCAKSAYRSGAGLVNIYTPEANRTILQTLIPEAILTVYNPEAPERKTLENVMKWADAIVCGPGLSKSGCAQKILKMILKNTEVPLVLDADALNLISESDENLKALFTDQMILTPHVGEMSRLCGKKIPEIKDDLIFAAREFADRYKVTCVLKDARTVIAGEDFLILNETGNDGMSTGGSGDALAGIIGAFLAAGMKPGEAAAAGCYIHGKSGEKASLRYGRHGMTGKDLPEEIGVCLMEYEENSDF